MWVNLLLFPFLILLHRSGTLKLDARSSGIMRLWSTWAPSLDIMSPLYNSRSSFLGRFGSISISGLTNPSPLLAGLFSSSMFYVPSLSINSCLWVSACMGTWVWKGSANNFFVGRMKGASIREHWSPGTKPLGANLKVGWVLNRSMTKVGLSRWDGSPSSCLN